MIVWRLFYVVLTISVILLLYGIYVLFSVRSGISNIPDSYAYGAADADITVIEFLDYTCADCRAVYPVIRKAVEADGKVRYIPLPIAGPNTPGEYGMRLTYAAGLQNKYKETYEYLMKTYRGSIDETNVTDLALATGMNDEQLREDMQSEIVNQKIYATGSQYSALGGKNIPFFLIGDKITYEPTTTPSAEDFHRLFREARQQ